MLLLLGSAGKWRLCCRKEKGTCSATKYKIPPSECVLRDNSPAEKKGRARSNFLKPQNLLNTREREFLHTTQHKKPTPKANCILFLNTTVAVTKSFLVYLFLNK